MMKKEDVRITKTKRDLRKALMDLLLEVSFEKMTVSDICARALINRMTFYKHYADKYALLDDALESLREEIYRRHRARYGETQSVRDFCVTIMNDVLLTCMDNQNFLRALLHQDNTVVVDVIGKTLQEGVKNLIDEIDLRAPAKYPKAIVTAVVCGGASNAIYYWLTHPAEFTQSEFLDGADRMMTDLIDSGLFFRTETPT